MVYRIPFGLFGPRGDVSGCRAVGQRGEGTALFVPEGYTGVDFTLIRLQSDGKTASAPISRERTVVGRQTGCHLRIRSSQVSREHAEIRFEDGTPIVKDLGSSNGTFVNGVKIIEKRLEAGDLVAIGPVVLMVQLDGVPDSYDAASLYEDGRPGGAAAPAQATPSSEQPAQDAGASADPMDAPTTTGLMDGIAGLPTDPDDSSVVDFDFNFEDDDDDQPPL